MNKKRTEQFADLIEEIENQASEFACDKEIDDFEIKDLGEVFWVTRNGEPYSYYYGPEIRNK